MLVAIISILILTFSVWLISRLIKIKICPVCAGVSLTWLWMLIGILTGKLSVISYQLIVGILMGGTIVGSVAKLENKIKERRVLLWKTLFVSAGFMAVYSLVKGQWIILAVSLLFAVAITLVFSKFASNHSLDTKNVKELEAKMKKCC